MPLTLFIMNCMQFTPPSAAEQYNVLIGPHSGTTMSQAAATAAAEAVRSEDDLLEAHDAEVSYYIILVILLHVTIRSFRSAVVIERHIHAA